MRLAVCLGALVMATGCSFPEPTVVDLGATDSAVSDSIAKSDSISGDGTVTDTAVVADGTTSDDGNDGGTNDGATEAGDTSVGDQGVGEVGDGGQVGDADSAIDARTDAPETIVCVTACDCDGDGDNKPGPPCNGTDCDDGDPRRNGKVTTFQTHDATGTTHGGDWDCSGTAEKEFGNGGFGCGGILAGPACTNSKGYTTAENSVKCGGMATIGGCKVELTLCVVDSTKTQTNQIVKCK